MNAADFTRRLLVHAQLTKFELTAEVIDAYDRILGAHGYDRVCSALDAMLSTRSPRDGFPSVKEILAAISPELDTQSAAVVAANRIWGAVAAHGWPNARSARVSLGEAIWAVVEAAGGWATVCSDANEMDPGTFKAQMRELAKAHALSGAIKDRPALQGPSTLALGGALKSLTDMNTKGGR